MEVGERRNSVFRPYADEQSGYQLHISGSYRLAAACNKQQQRFVQWGADSYTGSNPSNIYIYILKEREIDCSSSIISSVGGVNQLIMAFDKNNEEWDGSEHDEPWIKWYVFRAYVCVCDKNKSWNITRSLTYWSLIMNWKHNYPQVLWIKGTRNVL